jgi:hypothetical protein
MQVKGEAIKEHVSDKEATYQIRISVFYIRNIQLIYKTEEALILETTS